MVMLRGVMGSEGGGAISASDRPGLRRAMAKLHEST
jgi:hypothetical protein